MLLFALPDGQIDQRERAAWLTPIFDLYLGPVLTTPTGAYAPEVSWGPFLGAPWHARRRPEAEGGRLVLAPPAPPPSTTPAPEIAAGPPMRGAPWLGRLPLEEGLRGSPGTGLLLPGSAHPSLAQPRVSRVVRKDEPDRRLGRHSEQVQSILNSLLDRGYLRLTSQNPLRYEILGGSLTGEGPPTSDTDAAAGAVLGCCYVDTRAGVVYFCVDATIAAARWRGPF
jgi:hypothetical protein